jgi:CRP/FNR family transcriptional regulator, anaerobic regulatory protein
MSSHLPEQCLHCSMYFDAENFCAKLSKKELIALNAGSSLVNLKRSESISEETQKLHPVMAISSGVLSLQYLLHDGRKTIAAILMRGDILDLRNCAQHKLGALVALNSVTLCRLSPAVFDASIAANAKARMLAWGNITDQTFRAINHAADLAKKQALEKLASFILEISNRDARMPGKDHVQIPIRRYDLAEYLGMQPETVSRCFKDLAERDIIRVSDLSVVRIIDASALRRIANGDRAPKGKQMDDPAFKILVADA